MSIDVGGAVKATIIAGQVRGRGSFTAQISADVALLRMRCRAGQSLKRHGTKSPA
jgi:hypothetical protein